MSEIAKAIEEIRQELPQTVRLIAVSKTHAAERVREAYDVGVRDFGENKVQEMVQKAPMLPSDIRWHLIGHLQTNKVKYIIDKVVMIHSVDSLKLAEEIDKRAAAAGKTMDVLLQVNAYDLYLNPKDDTRNLAQWMAKEALISFIGSDMHGPRMKADGKPARRPQMKEGIRWLYENIDDEYANEIVRINAERYLGVEKLL